MAEQKQPQVIMSPDNKIQILHHRMSANRFGHSTVTGVLKNLTSSPTVIAEITVEYYDGSGTLIGTAAEIMRIMEPGRTGAFEVVYSGERRWDIETYKIVSLRKI